MKKDLAKKMGVGEVSYFHFGSQDDAIVKYVGSLLFGTLKYHLAEHNVKVFKGVSKEMSRKYMKKFNELLKFNGYTTGPLDNGFDIDYNGRPAKEYYGFFVFQNARGNVFGSFASAYKFANKTYLFDHMILGNATKQLALNTQVSFGHVIIQDGGMVYKDLEKVVNNKFYKILIGE